MSEFLKWLDKEIALHENENDVEIDTREINPVPEIFKDVLRDVKSKTMNIKKCI